ncbi:putative reverse transcriptase domain-containing protein [Tanacetum coccineum]
MIARGRQYILNQKELNSDTTERWIVFLLSDYDCEIRYHPGKANVVADALSRKGRDKPLHVRALMMTVHNDLPKQIREAQGSMKKKEAEHQKPSGLLQQPEIPVWKSLQKALGINLDMSTAYRPQTDGQSERIIQTLEDMLRVCVIDFGNSWDHHLPLVEFSYNNSYHTSIKAAPYEALYERKCRPPVCWSVVGDNQLTGPELICDTTEKIVQIKNRIAMEGHLKPLEIVDKEVKRLKQSRIPIVKVHWNSQRGPKFTWEREDQIKKKYPHLFTSKDFMKCNPAAFHGVEGVVELGRWFKKTEFQVNVYP